MVEMTKPRRGAKPRAAQKATPKAGAPKKPKRGKGIGAVCPECESTDTWIRRTRKHPYHVAIRRRYHECGGCGCVWLSEGRHPN